VVLSILQGVAVAPRPKHIKAIADEIKNIKPREVPIVETVTRLSGLESFLIKDDSLFVNVGERTNVTGSKAFANLIINEKYDEALSVARQQVENGRKLLISIWMKVCLML
jgi:5-methyltetrahydrofolate--homocysteine methyltransferase